MFMVCGSGFLFLFCGPLGYLLMKLYHRFLLYLPFRFTYFTILLRLVMVLAKRFRSENDGHYVDANYIFTNERLAV